MINFFSANLTDSDVATIAVMGAKDRFVSVFDPKDPHKIISLPDFGTLLIGFQDLSNIDNLEFFVREPNDPSMDVVWFTMDELNKLAPLVKRLGMFPSNSQAVKNGFGGEIPVGFSQTIVRVNKMRGVLSILKKE